jgi:signal transduction histidine kinase
VAQAAHQLRTPLTILKSYLSVLSDSIGNQLTADNKENLDRAVVGSNQLSLLIENLLNVSKIEGGKLDLHPLPSSIEQITVSAINKNLNNAVQRGVKVQFQQEGGPLPQIIVDPNLIEQAISNLLANAIENSKSDSEVLISLGLQGNNIVISVIDHGVGIPSEATNKLFTKFYKVSTNLVQSSKGIGLGLYNTRAIIEAHGGAIQVNSLLGKGSTFWFTLPVRK